VFLLDVNRSARHAGFRRHIGAENILSNVEVALARRSNSGGRLPDGKNGQLFALK
jgi:hypothetical protein